MVPNCAYSGLVASEIALEKCKQVASSRRARPEDKGVPVSPPSSLQVSDRC